MLFKDGQAGRMANEWREQIHPDLRTLLIEFERYSERLSLPEPVLTDLVRNTDEQIAIYTRYWRKLQAALLPGPLHGMVDLEDDGTWRPLTPREWQEAKEVRGLSDAELIERARKKFTWHWAHCAADIRNRHYSKERRPAPAGDLLSQLELVVAFFAPRCKKPQWEFLVHDVTAPHIHVARRDFAWRARYSPSSLTPA